MLSRPIFRDTILIFHTFHPTLKNSGRWYEFAIGFEIRQINGACSLLDFFNPL